MILCIEI